MPIVGRWVHQLDPKAVLVSGLSAGAAFVVDLETDLRLTGRVENAVLYPVTRFEDIHPAIRSGLVDRYYTWPAFWQSVPRHIAFGAVLGVLYDRLRRRDSRMDT